MAMALAAAVIISVANSPQPMAQDAVQVPGTSVKMAPPPGFAPASDFAGFANVEKQGSLLIAEMPAEAMAQLAPLFGDQQKAAASFATKGIIVDGQEEIETKSGETALLLHGTQEAHGTKLDKWMALYAGEKTVMITFQIPQQNAIDAATIKTAFASVEAGAAPAANAQLSALPFEIEAAQPFRIIQTLAGASVLMMAGDKDVDPQGKQPLAIAAYSKVAAPVKDLAASAAAALKAAAHFSAATITSREETTFAGTDGIVFQGTVDHKGIKKRFTQSFAVTEDGKVMHFLASAPDAEYDGLKDAIDEIAGSIEFKN
jgi:hypothetical protein